MPSTYRFWSQEPTHPIIEITSRGHQDHRAQSTLHDPDDQIRLVIGPRNRPNTAGTVESEAKTVIGTCEESNNHKKLVVDHHHDDDDDDRESYSNLLRRLDLVILPLTALLYVSLIS